MRKGNVTILASVLAMVLVAAGVGMGTRAYFSDVETVDVGQFYAATLGMQIKEPGGDFGDATIEINPSPLAPGDTFTVDVLLKNVGDIDIQYVYTHFRDLTFGDGLPNPEQEWDEDVAGLHLVQKIALVKVDDYSPNNPSVDHWATKNFDPDIDDGAETSNAWLKFWNTDPNHPAPFWTPYGYYTAPEDGSISLFDLVYCAEPGGFSERTSFFFHTDGILPYLPKGETVHIRMTFRLLEDTDNRAQSDTCSFYIDFIGSNTDDGALLDASFR